MPSEPIRPASMTLAGAVGQLRCACGFDLPIQNLTGPVRCPRCGQEWVIKAAITQAPEPHTPGDGSPPTG